MKKYKVIGIDKNGNSIEFVKKFENKEKLDEYMNENEFLYSPIEIFNFASCIDITETNIKPYFKNYRNNAEYND